MVDSLIEVQEFLETVRIPMRLACRTKNEWPAVVSLWYLHQDGLLYCATQRSAKVVSYLEHDARCAFEISEDQPPYCGIRGKAKARIDHNQGAAVLEKLLVRYLGGTETRLARKLLAKSESEVAIVLEPMRIYRWDFSRRMKDITIDQPAQKICPG